MPEPKLELKPGMLVLVPSDCPYAPDGTDPVLCIVFAGPDENRVGLRPVGEASGVYYIPRMSDRLYEVNIGELAKILDSATGEDGAAQRDWAKIELKTLVSRPPPVEFRWEINRSRLFHTAKLIEEIPPNRAESLADTMAPIEHLGSVAFTTAPWTVSAFTAGGLERKIRRYERKLGITVRNRDVRDGSTGP